MAADWDYKLDDNLDIQMPLSRVRGYELAAQRIRVRLSVQLGTWPFDLAVGLPYLEWMEAGTPPLASIETNMRRAIEGVPGVVRIRQFQVTFDTNTGVVSARGDIYYQDIGVVPTQITVGQAGVLSLAPLPLAP